MAEKDPHALTEDEDKQDIKPFEDPVEDKNLRIFLFICFIVLVAIIIIAVVFVLTNDFGFSGNIDSPTPITDELQENSTTTLGS